MLISIGAFMGLGSHAIIGLHDMLFVLIANSFLSYHCYSINYCYNYLQYSHIPQALPVYLSVANHCLNLSYWY